MRMNICISGYKKEQNVDDELKFISLLSNTVDNNPNITSSCGISTCGLTNNEVWNIIRRGITKADVLILRINEDMDTSYVMHCTIAKMNNVPVLALNEKKLDIDWNTQLLIDNVFTNYDDLVDHINFFY